MNANADPAVGLLALHGLRPAESRTPIGNSGFPGMACSHLRLGNRLVIRALGQAHDRASQIADASIREATVRALGKRGNVEGAALLATTAPRAHRETALAAIISFQLAYNHLDWLSERPSGDPVAASRGLHRALVAAVQPDECHVDYFAYTPIDGDDGYLLELLESCRTAVRKLPSLALVAPALISAAERIREFQALSLPAYDHKGLRAWATAVAPAGLSWCESAAAAGSSLTVHALLCAAADPQLEPDDARAIEQLYRSAGGALHSLLDSLVDRDEDRAFGQISLYECYPDDRAASARLAQLASSAVQAAERTSKPRLHRAILTAMCSYYLSAPQRDATAQHLVRARLLDVYGPWLRAALMMFRLRRLRHELTRDAYV